MTPKQAQVRRKELHAVPMQKLMQLYADKSGHLLFEVKNMVRGLPDEGRQLIIDSLIRREGDV